MFMAGLVPVGKDAESEEWQYRELRERCSLPGPEEIARGAGFLRLAIMSGIGVRPYYRGRAMNAEVPI